ncbi:PREDICTED: uncharacterized protein At4g04775-like [Brassica oleracea var. oleracea]|uniref:uncharacterized protein At4g04775-like n=1 Tax=Brassica oleracea var. oleracea TaxID=109376 RepID=UPI0006A6B3BD|nr:PREDICTED: uncharacterized protein At4g04775-like [Brassica oleracea var. oleracea]
MSSSSNPNSSYGTAMSQSFSRRRVERERGFPAFCRKCGEAAVIFTSKTLKNPGRLFHGCPNGSEEDKNHLFKWTDESAVEEIHDIKSLFDEKIGHLELQSQRCEDVIRSYDKKIEDLGDALGGLGKEMKEMKELVQGYERDVKSLKKIVVCGVGMMLVYYYFAM